VKGKLPGRNQAKRIENHPGGRKVTVPENKAQNPIVSRSGEEPKNRKKTEFLGCAGSAGGDSSEGFSPPLGKNRGEQQILFLAGGEKNQGRKKGGLIQRWF